MLLEEFQTLVRQKGKQLYREMPWRSDTRPYYVLVSELMLQQTQVSRVSEKFIEFITRFPDEQSLAAAPLADVLYAWQGLGYNRRAKYLHDSTTMIVDTFDGRLPTNLEELMMLPGVGKNTAGALLAYAFNQPSIFIETNIRTVYIHHFFNDSADVTDAQIAELLMATIDRANPRTFYWALMDYGSQLKRQGVRVNHKSRHYKKQPALAGSVREVRGQIIAVLQTIALTDTELRVAVDADERYDRAVHGLQHDGLIEQRHSVWRLTQ